MLRRALELCDEHRLSLWDARIVVAAAAGGCGTLYTEDLQHGRVIDSVAIVNPFAASDGRQDPSIVRQ